MGSENSKFLSDQQLPHQYRPLKQLPGVYQSILNGSRFQKHKIELNSEADIKYEKQIFIFRRMHADRIISAHFFQKFTPHHFCNMSYQVCFFTQFPLNVLSLDFILPVDKSFQLLIQCLKGFEILFSKFGAFYVNCKNIFFDIHNQPRVWISSNLGKTRVDNTNTNYNEQKMIIDIFRLFDQIKDERNSKVTFSNYLKKTHQKSNCITFKNVIMYLVDEASKFFVSRTKSKQSFERIPVVNNNPNIIKNLTHRGHQYKQNTSHVISLKTRNTNRNSCDTGGYTSTCPSYLGYAKYSQLQRQTHEKTKKSKRHNSQEDYKSRQIHLFKQNHLIYNGDQIILSSKPLQKHQQTDYRYQDLNTLRLFRKHTNQTEKIFKQQSKNFNQFENTTRKIVQNDVRKDFQLQKSPHQKLYKVVQTEFQRQNLYKPPSNQFQNPSIQFYTQNKQKHVNFQKNQLLNINHTPNSKKQFSVLMTPSQDFNQSQLMLNNLQTLKSIVNSQYSDIDSQIREDLQNLHF